MLGFLNLHKPLGLTSHDCVARVRRLLKTKKVGHGGTLDPQASGVLPLAVGQATRLLNYLPTDKAYRGRIRFGVRTSTDDLEGEVLVTQSAAHLLREQVEVVLPEFLGTIPQIPPRYSAIHVQGKRLYELARAGIEVTVPSRQVRIDRLEILQWHPGEHPELELEIHCGPGTYIRSLARDLGDRLGVGATLGGLVRIASAGFALGDSVSLETLGQQAQDQAIAWVPLAQSLGHWPRVTLADESIQAWFWGQTVMDVALQDPLMPLPTCPMPPTLGTDDETIVAVYGESDRFLGMGCVQGHDRLSLSPKVVMSQSP